MNATFCKTILHLPCDTALTIRVTSWITRNLTRNRNYRGIQPGDCYSKENIAVYVPTQDTSKVSKLQKRATRGNSNFAPRRRRVAFAWMNNYVANKLLIYHAFLRRLLWVENVEWRFRYRQQRCYSECPDFTVLLLVIVKLGANKRSIIIILF